MFELIVGAVILGVSVIAADFVGGIGNRLARRWIPLPSEKANVENVRLRREELEAQERRFLIEQQERRDLKLFEIEKTREMRREEEENRFRHERWPLRILPGDFLRASAAREGRALNILFNVVEHRDANFLKSPGAGSEINRLLDMLNGGPFHAMRQAATQFQGDVILYQETLKTTRYTGDTLRSTLWSLLQTEPTILVELNIPTPDQFKIYVSHWGNAFEPNAPWMSDSPQTINFKELSADTEAAFGIGLSGLIVALGDAFRTLHRPYEIQAPLFPLFLQNAVPPSLPLDVLRPMFNAYASAYDGVAMHSPLLASELAARAAIASHQAGLKEFAAALLDKSLHLHPTLRGNTELDTATLAMFCRHHGRQGTLSEMGKALEVIRQINGDDHTTGSSSAYGDDNFEIFMERLGTRKRKGIDE